MFAPHNIIEDVDTVVAVVDPQIIVATPINSAVFRFFDFVGQDKRPQGQLLAVKVPIFKKAIPNQVEDKFVEVTMATALNLLFGCRFVMIDRQEQETATGISDM